MNVGFNKYHLDQNIRGLLQYFFILCGAVWFGKKNFGHTANTYRGMTAECQRINVISLMWDTSKNSKSGLQFFRVSHIREIILIHCHSAVIPLYVFAVQNCKTLVWLVITDWVWRVCVEHQVSLSNYSSILLRIKEIIWTFSWSSKQQRS